MKDFFRNRANFYTNMSICNKNTNYLLKPRRKCATSTTSTAAITATAIFKNLHSTIASAIILVDVVVFVAFEGFNNVIICNVIVTAGCRIVVFVELVT